MHMGGFSEEIARMILALAFKSKSSIRLTGEELKFFFTLDMHWFTPAEAERFIDNCKKARLLLTKDGKTYSPSFDPTKEPTPKMGFKPDLEALLTYPTNDEADYVPDSEDDGEEELDNFVPTDDDANKNRQKELPVDIIKDKDGEKSSIDSKTPPPTEKKLLVRMIEHMINNSELEKRNVIQKINLYGSQYLLEPEASALIIGAEMGIDMSEFIKDVEKAIYRRAGA